MTRRIVSNSTSGTGESIARPPAQLDDVYTGAIGTDNLPISPLQLITDGLSVIGHPSGTSRDIEETMHFAVQTGVRAVIEERPLAEAAAAYEAMETGKARYRMVLTV